MNYETMLVVAAAAAVVGWSSSLSSSSDPSAPIDSHPSPRLPTADDGTDTAAAATMVTR